MVVVALLRGRRFRVLDLRRGMLLRRLGDAGILDVFEVGVEEVLEMIAEVNLKVDGEVVVRVAMLRRMQWGRVVVWMVLKLWVLL